MFLLKFLLLSIPFINASETIRVFCDVKDDNKTHQHFTLAANLKIDKETKAVNTEAIISFSDKKNNTSPPMIVESEGFFRSIPALGGYNYAVLVPIETGSGILSMNLKVNISANMQSSVELEETHKFFSNCRSL